MKFARVKALPESQPVRKKKIRAAVPVSRLAGASLAVYRIGTHRTQEFADFHEMTIRNLSMRGVAIVSMHAVVASEISIEISIMPGESYTLPSLSSSPRTRMLYHGITLKTNDAICEVTMI